MRYFSIIITSYLPYPLEERYTERAGQIETAILRAIKAYKDKARQAGKMQVLSTAPINIKAIAIKNVKVESQINQTNI